MSLIKFNRNHDFFPNILGDIFNDDMLDKFTTRMSIPAVNLKETETGFEIQMATPGLKKEDLKITIENNILVISSETQIEKEEEEQGKFTRREYSYRKFSRSFSLPESADTENIEAKYENGELILNLPKKENNIKKSREINIM